MTRVTGQRRCLVLCLCVIGAVAFSACDGDSPTSPSSTNVVGTWTGAITSNLSGTGTARVTLTQSGSSVGGTWSATFPTATNAGTVSGTLSGASLSITLTPGEVLLCPLSVTATVTGESMTGTWAAFNCTSTGSGSLALTRTG